MIICGINPFYWSEKLKESNVRINSLRACIVVYDSLNEQYEGNTYKTLKHYKGIKDKEDIWMVTKVIEAKKELENK